MLLISNLILYTLFTNQTLVYFKTLVVNMIIIIITICRSYCCKFIQIKFQPKADGRVSILYTKQVWQQHYFY